MHFRGCYLNHFIQQFGAGLKMRCNFPQILKYGRVPSNRRISLFEEKRSRCAAYAVDEIHARDQSDLDLLVFDGAVDNGFEVDRFPQALSTGKCEDLRCCLLCSISPAFFE